MNICGIIVEYNPFHNGHRYHIEKAKELTSCDVLIAVMSGNYTQRGDLSVMDKFAKTEIALDNGIDIVVELPYIYATQSASSFSKGAIEALKVFGVDSIVFGSETNNLEELKEIAALEVNPDHFKEMIKTGISFPKAYGLLAKEFLPNDILAIAYLKAIRNTAIRPYTIQRTNDFHSEDIKSIASAKAIRKAIKEKKDYHLATDVKIDHPVFIDDLYPYLRRLLMLKKREDLEKIHLVSEGIEKIFIDNAFKYPDFASFLNASTSKRYTASRIKRTLLQIMIDVKKSEVDHYYHPYARVLGFNDKGQKLIKELRKNGAPIETQIKKIPPFIKDIELKATYLYASLFDEKRFQYLVKRELAGPIIKSSQ